MTKTNKSVVKPTSEKTVRSMYIDDAFNVAIARLKEVRKAAAHRRTVGVICQAEPIELAFAEAVATIKTRRTMMHKALPWYKRTWNAIRNWFKK